MNLFFILLFLVYLVFFHTNHHLLNSIVKLGTQAYLNFSRLSHGVCLNFFKVSHVKWENILFYSSSLDCILRKSAFDLVHCGVSEPSRLTSVHGFEMSVP